MGSVWSGWRQPKIQTTSRPDYVWSEAWTKIGIAVRNREEQEWAEEKPKLDNARKLKGIYFIGPYDREYSEILKKARRKLERLMAPAMPCKRMDKQHICLTKVKAEPKNGKEKESKTMYG